MEIDHVLRKIPLTDSHTKPEKKDRWCQYIPKKSYSDYKSGGVTLPEGFNWKTFWANFEPPLTFTKVELTLIQ